MQPGAAIDYDQGHLHLAEPLVGDFNQRLQTALATHGQQLVTCGSCCLWEPSTVVTPEQLPTGACRWRAETEKSESLPPTLALQSALALPCPHWQPLSASGATEAPAVDGAERQALAPMRKVAESAEIRLTWWQRFQKRLQARWQRRQARDWKTMFLERSGVGAGTEPCFVCQGRIANLGALTGGTPEGDKQTFSVWRCRHCYTTYLNHWIDRWERLDNLETEERYYRIAPAEAKNLLTLIYSVVGGEHPNRRHERQAEQAHFLAFMAARTPLSHQIRQGR
ncbi:MAG: hypothetical protein DYG89_35635 [Caldilinea sp. CFX5]|nr:hypothetical protein [Caldilinea sp. CFX5]